MSFNFTKLSLAARFMFKSRIRKEPVQVHRVLNPYHAVSIRPGLESCTTAQKRREERFLSAEAPPLPLERCDVGKCSCRYQHHEDRRSGSRRASDYGHNSSASQWSGQDRRVVSIGRRSSDM
jgi:hypothetical protein